MKTVTRAIREATGLTIKEFCESHLKSKWVSFSARLKNNRLYPNEYIYICLITGQKFSDLFEDSFNNKVLFHGEESVTEKINEILSSQGWTKLNNLIDSSSIEINSKAALTEQLQAATDVLSSLMAKDQDYAIKRTERPSFDKIEPIPKRKDKKSQRSIPKISLPAKAKTPPLSREAPPKEDSFQYEETY